MPVSAARKIAYQILRRVDSGRAFAVDLLQECAVAGLGERDRRLATELVMGVLRWRGALDFEIERLAQRPVTRLDPEVLTILRLGVYQIHHLERVPKPAVVNESVELAKAARKRSAAALVNAALRKCEVPSQRPKESSTPVAGELDSACRAVPRWLLARWNEHFGVDAARRLAWESVQPPRTTLRVRGDAGARERIRQRLAGEQVDAQPGQYASQALVVQVGKVQQSETWRDGLVVIQDEASQLIVELLRARPGDSLLDLCAAPGIKAAQIAEEIGGGALVCCDRSAQRLRTMARLLRTRAPTNAAPLLVQLDATAPLPFRGTFTRILLDAPCSGTGTLARNPEIKWRLRPEDLARLAESQVRMLEQVVDRLASGGRLVYATCSLEPEENENVIEHVLAARPDVRQLDRETLALELPHLAPLFDPRGYFRTRPDRDGMDGFFAAVIEKPS